MAVAENVPDPGAMPTGADSVSVIDEETANGASVAVFVHVDDVHCHPSPEGSVVNPAMLGAVNCTESAPGAIGDGEKFVTFAVEVAGVPMRMVDGPESESATASAASGAAPSGSCSETAAGSSPSTVMVTPASGEAGTPVSATSSSTPSSGAIVAALPSGPVHAHVAPAHDHHAPPEGDVDDGSTVDRDAPGGRSDTVNDAGRDVDPVFITPPVRTVGAPVRTPVAATNEACSPSGTENPAGDAVSR